MVESREGEGERVVREKREEDGTHQLVCSDDLAACTRLVQLCCSTLGRRRCPTLHRCTAPHVPRSAPSPLADAQIHSHKEGALCLHVAFRGVWEDEGLGREE